nr:MAG TPA: hypothetical protein [Caudoviricetes sp.]
MLPKNISIYVRISSLSDRAASIMNTRKRALVLEAKHHSYLHC